MHCASPVFQPGTEGEGRDVRTSQTPVRHTIQRTAEAAEAEAVKAEAVKAEALKPEAQSSTGGAPWQS